MGEAENRHAWILNIARAWSFWDQAPTLRVARKAELPTDLSPSICTVVQGVRRCGKSTLLEQMLLRYGLPPEDCAFLNCEDPRLSNALDFETLDILVQAFRASRGSEPTLYFFLDEIQAIQGWERWLRMQLERPQNQVFVLTGSNASLLSGELGSALTGRHLSVELFPFDLEERRLLVPDLSVERFLSEGGFPEPVQMTDRDRLLRQYFADILERDIRERLKARSIRPLSQVVQMVYESAGSELSLRRVAASAGVSTDTAGSYLEACEAAYLLFRVPFFAFSERKRAHRNAKYYPVDTGLRRAVVAPATADRGKDLECAVYLALRRKNIDVSYWRGNGEVDFVLRHGNRIKPVQVTWEEEVEARHENALVDFYESFPFAEEAAFVNVNNYAGFARDPWSA